MILKYVAIREINLVKTRINLKVYSFSLRTEFALAKTRNVKSAIL